VILFLGSLAIPTPERYILWTLALVIDLLTPLSTIPHQRFLPQFSTSRLPERFGLFTIIVLGETIIGVVSGLAENHHLTVEIGVVGFLGMTVAFGLWWLYFDGVSHHPPRFGLRGGLARNYLHLPLVLGITAIGAAVLNVVGHSGHGVPDAVRWLLCCSTALVLVCLGALMVIVDPGERTHRRRNAQIWGVFGAAAATVLLGALGGSLGAVPLVACLLALLVLLILADVTSR